MEENKIYNELSKRDYTESENDLYAQTLQTIFFNCSASGEVDKFYNLLEKAENENKKLSIPDDLEEYVFSSISMI